MLAGGANFCEPESAVLIELVGVLSPQQFGVTVDTAQGSAEIVGNGVGKSFEFLVGSFEFGGATGYALFEFSVDPDIFHGYGSGIGKGLKQFQFLSSG